MACVFKFTDGGMLLQDTWGEATVAEFWFPVRLALDNPSGELGSHDCEFCSKLRTSSKLGSSPATWESDSSGVKFVNPLNPMLLLVAGVMDPPASCKAALLM